MITIIVPYKTAAMLCFGALVFAFIKTIHAAIKLEEQKAREYEWEDVHFDKAQSARDATSDVP